eukprot:m.183979 g.183979  ORF g.183979 m.183979 type:complete len:839 (-) comp16000_c0_seq1:170-2686(-)
MPGVQTMPLPIPRRTDTRQSASPRPVPPPLAPKPKLPPKPSTATKPLVVVSHANDSSTPVDTPLSTPSFAHTAARGGVSDARVASAPDDGNQTPSSPLEAAGLLTAGSTRDRPVPVPVPVPSPRRTRRGVAVGGSTTTPTAAPSHVQPLAHEDHPVPNHSVLTSPPSVSASAAHQPTVHPASTTAVAPGPTSDGSDIGDAEGTQVGTADDEPDETAPPVLAASTSVPSTVQRPQPPPRPPRVRARDDAVGSMKPTVAVALMYDNGHLMKSTLPNSHTEGAVASPTVYTLQRHGMPPKGTDTTEVEPTPPPLPARHPRPSHPHGDLPHFQANPHSNPNPGDDAIDPDDWVYEPVDQDFRKRSASDQRRIIAGETLVASPHYETIEDGDDLDTIEGAGDAVGAGEGTENDGTPVEAAAATTLPQHTSLEQPPQVKPFQPRGEESSAWVDVNHTGVDTTAVEVVRWWPGRKKAAVPSSAYRQCMSTVVPGMLPLMTVTASKTVPGKAAGDLPFGKGDTIAIMQMDNCPPGMWVGRSIQLGYYGFVRCTDVQVDPSQLRSIMEALSHAVPPRQTVQTSAEGLPLGKKEAKLGIYVQGSSTAHAAKTSPVTTNNNDPSGQSRDDGDDGEGRAAAGTIGSPKIPAIRRQRMPSDAAPAPPPPGVGPSPTVEPPPEDEADVGLYDNALDTPKGLVIMRAPTVMTVKLNDACTDESGSTRSHDDRATPSMTHVPPDALSLSSQPIYEDVTESLTGGSGGSGRDGAVVAAAPRTTPSSKDDACDESIAAGEPISYKVPLKDDTDSDDRQNVLQRRGTASTRSVASVLSMTVNEEYGTVGDQVECPQE